MLEGEIARVGDSLRRRPQPYGLSEAELQHSGIRRDAPAPIPVTAWIPHQVHYEDPQLVDGEVIAWTDHATLVRWTPREGVGPHHTWIYADAVTRKIAPSD